MPVPTTYIPDANGWPLIARAIIAVVGNAAGGTPVTIANNQVQGHMGNARTLTTMSGAHLIGRQLGGDGGDPQNLVGLSDMTNGSLMADFEGECSDIIRAQQGAQVILETEVDYSNANYNGPLTAPHQHGMVEARSQSGCSTWTGRFSSAECTRTG